MSKKQYGYDMLFKLILLGDSAVGKTNILSKYLRNEFDQNSKSTVGVEFSTRNLKIDSYIVKVQIWDTAGQERYRSITNAYYKGAKGGLLIFDLTRRSTFDSIDKWIPDLKTKGDENMVIILIGNKSDLKEQRQVSTEEGEKKAKLFKLAYMETSALDGNNIENAFNELINTVYKKNYLKIEKEIISHKIDKGIDLSNRNSIDKTSCCTKF